MAAAGFTLYEIGEMTYRKDEDYSDEEEESMINKEKEKSILEKLVNQAESLYFLVKENGIKSTVNFQLKLVNDHKKLEESLPSISEGSKK